MYLQAIKNNHSYDCGRAYCNLGEPRIERIDKFIRFLCRYDVPFCNKMFAEDAESKVFFFSISSFYNITQHYNQVEIVEKEKLASLSTLTVRLLLYSR